MIWNLSARYRLEAATGRGINRCSRQERHRSLNPCPRGEPPSPATRNPHTPSPDAKSSGPDHTPLPELTVEPFPKRKQNVPAALKLGATPEPFQNCLANNPTRPLGATPDQQGISTSPIRRSSLGLIWLAECACSPPGTLLLVRMPS